MVKKEFKRQSLLWKISGNNIIHPSYLLGTMHLIPKKYFVISKKIFQTLGKCNELFLELNLANEKEMSKAQDLQTSNTLISQSLNKKEATELNQILKKSYKISLAEVDHLHPMMLMNKMVTTSFEDEEMTAIEMELIVAAFKTNIKIKGLETVKAQIKIAQKLFTPKELLRQMRMGDDYQEVMQSMIEAYKNGDLETLQNSVNDRRYMTEEAEKLLVTNRNKSWSRKIPKLISNGNPIFFAVGAGHLGGENGLIALLKNQGFKLRSIKW